VLTVVEDSWVEIRRPGNLPSLIARLVKGGSTETFEIDGQALLIVGKPGNVRATLRGQHLDLPVVPNGTIARVQIK
jgi:cytoskeleton protein RodZ